MVDSAVKRGVAMVALAGVVWSLQGVTIRIIDVANAEQTVFWRAIGQLVVQLALVTALSRGRVLQAFQAAGLAAIIGGLCIMTASTAFVFALSYTTVANVVFILAASPFVSALLAWLILGEVVSGRTIAAMTIALVGIGVMVSEGQFTANLTGNLFAFLACLGFSGIAVVARWGRGVSMLPAPCWGALAMILVAYYLSAGDVSVPPSDIGVAMFSGGVITATGATLFLLGSRYVPAAVLTLLTLTEVVLAPVWVWIGFDEVPGTLTLVGGVIVLGAITVEGLLRIRQPTTDATQTTTEKPFTFSRVRRRFALDYFLPLTAIATGLCLLLVSVVLWWFERQ